MFAWSKWLQGLFAAVVGGSCQSIVTVMVDPYTFNLDAGLTNLLKVFLCSAIFNMAFYLKAHPTPDVIGQIVQPPKE